MEAVVEQGVSVQDALQNLAGTDAEKFSAFFRKARKLFPAEVAQACLCYLAQKGLDGSGQKMALWLAAEVKYLKILFDPSALPFETASTATTALDEARTEIKYVEPTRCFDGDERQGDRERP